MGRRGLAGLSVVQVGGGLPPAVAAKLLGDVGAHIIRIEDPAGDELRGLGPTLAEGPDSGGALFRYVAAGADSRIADLATDAGRRTFDGVLDEVAAAGGPVLVIDALGPGGLERVGLGPTDMGDRCPQLAVARLAPTGQGGDAALVTTELVLQAMGGWVSGHGDPGASPFRVGGRLASWVVGTYTAVAGLTAVRQARLREDVVIADVSAQECLVGSLPYPMLLQRTLRRLGAGTGARRYVVPGIVACQDGWVGVNALTGQQWQDICVLFDTPQFDGRQQVLLGDEEEYQAFLTAAAPWLSSRRADEIVELCQAFRIPAAPVGDGRTLPDLDHFVAREIYRSAGDGLRFPRPPQRFADDPAGAPPLPPAPRPGDRVAARDSPPWPPVDASADRGAFAGLRVLDLSIFWAGPYVTMYLGSLGADVVKVESPSRPDGFRFTATAPSLGDDWYEQSLVWQATNLDKRSLTLDLSTPAGLDILWRMIDRADVLVENFAPRVVEGFGLTAEAVLERNPALIYLRMPGFGLDGPWRDHVGWAMSYEQASGAVAVTGLPDRPPVNPGGFADPVVGLNAIVALHAALVDRDRTGHGALVEIPQIEVLTALTAEQVAATDLLGSAPARTGNRSDEVPVDGVFPADDDSWVAVSIRHEADWAAAASIFGEAEPMSWSAALADLDGAERVVGGWLVDRNGGDAVSALRNVGVPSAVVLEVAGMLDDPDLVRRAWYDELEHPVTGAAPYPSWPFRLSTDGDRQHDRAAPTLGQHNDEVLAELGLSDDDIGELRSTGVIHEGIRPPP